MKWPACCARWGCAAAAAAVLRSRCASAAAQGGRREPIGQRPPAILSRHLNVPVVGWPAVCPPAGRRRRKREKRGRRAVRTTRRRAAAAGRCRPGRRHQRRRASGQPRARCKQVGDSQAPSPSLCLCLSPSLSLSRCHFLPSLPLAACTGGLEKRQHCDAAWGSSLTLDAAHTRRSPARVSALQPATRRNFELT